MRAADEHDLATKAKAGAMMQPKPKPDVYRPPEVYCPQCGLQGLVTAAMRAWPNCPSCELPLVRKEEGKSS